MLLDIVVRGLKQPHENGDGTRFGYSSSVNAGTRCDIGESPGCFELEIRHDVVLEKAEKMREKSQRYTRKKRKAWWSKIAVSRDEIDF